jgi:hypothetical protein
MAVLMKSFYQEVNGTREDVVTDIDAFLIANPSITILSIAQSRSTTPRESDKLRIRLLYSDSGYANAAFLVSGSQTTPLDVAFAAFALANPTLRILTALDLTERTARSVDFGSILIIGTTDPVHAGNQVAVAEAIGGIAAGGVTSGAAKIYDSGANLISASTPVVNVSLTSAWPAGQRNLVVFDPDTNSYIGIPSCSGTGNPLP